MVQWTNLQYRKFHKLDATVHNLRKIWRPAPTGTRSYGRQAGSPAGWLAGWLADEFWAMLEILKACCT